MTFAFSSPMLVLATLNDAKHHFPYTAIFAAIVPSPSKTWTLPEAGMAVFHAHAAAPHLFHYFLPRLIAGGKSVLCLDGANRFDPLLIARFARQRGQEASAFTERLRVSRAFTCFQLTELLARAPRLLRDFPANVLIVTALPDLYFDEDVRECEATASFDRALEALLALRRLSLSIFPDATSFQTPRRNSSLVWSRTLTVFHGLSKRTEGLLLLERKSAPRLCRNQSGHGIRYGSHRILSYPVSTRLNNSRNEGAEALRQSHSTRCRFYRRTNSLPTWPRVSAQTAGHRFRIVPWE